MITDIFINMGSGIANFIIAIMPNGDTKIIQYLTDGFAMFRWLTAGINWIFPVNTFFFLLYSILTLEAVILSLRLILWIASIFIPMVKNRI
jgi:hypothetical protein